MADDALLGDEGLLDHSRLAARDLIRDWYREERYAGRRQLGVFLAACDLRELFTEIARG